MGTFNTSTFSLSSNATYYGQVSYSIEQLAGGRQFKVTINGVRVYCNQRYNFYSNVSTWIGYSGGVDAVYGGALKGIPAESVTGWSPSSGWSSSGNCSKTFYYNDDGTAPSVSLCGRFWNEFGVTYSGVKKYPDVQAIVDITSEIPRGTPLNVSLFVEPDTYYYSPYGYNATQICWYVSSNQTMNLWAYSIDGNPWIDYTTFEATYSTGIINVSSSIHTLQIRARSKATGNLGYSNIWTVDCRQPDLSGTTITVPSNYSYNEGILTLGNNIDIDKVTLAFPYSSVTIGEQISTTPIQYKISGINANVVQNYTLTATRKDNSYITNEIDIYATVTSPQLEIDITPKGLTCKLEIKSINNADLETLTFNIYYKDKTYTFDLEDSKIEGDTFTATAIGLVNSNDTSDKVSFLANESYTVYIRATNGKSLYTPYYNIGFKIQGCARIRIDTQWKPASVYICTSMNNNKAVWKLAIPYVYTDSGWKMCV